MAISPLSRISSSACPASPLMPYSYSRIYAAAVPVVLHLHNHDCPPSLSTSDLVFHSQYSTSLTRLCCHPPVSLLRSSSHCLPLYCVLCRRGLSLRLLPLWRVFRGPHFYHYQISTPSPPSYNLSSPLPLSLFSRHSLHRHCCICFHLHHFFYPHHIFIVCCHHVDNLLLLMTSFTNIVVHLLAHSSFSARIFSLFWGVLHYTTCSDLICTNFLTLSSNPLTMLWSSISARLFSLCAMLLLCTDQPQFSPLAFTPLCSNLIIPLSYVCFNLLALSLIWSTLIAPLTLWSSCSSWLGWNHSNMLCPFLSRSFNFY